VTDVARQLAESAGNEWSILVNTAVLGTDRRPLPAPAAGWESLPMSDDPALELLNRAAAVATARRAGTQAAPPPLPIEPAPPDPRPVSPPIAADLLDRMLRGAHDILLPEWMALCSVAGHQPPPHLTPTLLLRGRRNPAFDTVARALIGARAGWLADALPELGLRAAPQLPPPGTESFLPPARPPNSAAAVTAIVEVFLDRSATWAAAGHLRLAVAAVDPTWLPALRLELSRAPFHATTERSRIDLLGLAETRLAMIISFQTATHRSRPPQG